MDIDTTAPPVMLPPGLAFVPAEPVPELGLKPWALHGPNGFKAEFGDFDRAVEQLGKYVGKWAANWSRQEIVKGRYYVCLN